MVELLVIVVVSRFAFFNLLEFLLVVLFDVFEFALVILLDFSLELFPVLLLLPLEVLHFLLPVLDEGALQLHLLETVVGHVGQVDIAQRIRQQRGSPQSP